MTTETDNPLESVPKNNSGQFQKGKSGNPKGRPKGSRNKMTLKKLAMQNKLDKILVKEAPKVLEVVIDAAKSGDMKAAKMVFDALDLKKTEDRGNHSITIHIENLTGPKETSGITIEQSELTGHDAESHS